jgi:hypothetical protein
LLSLLIFQRTIFDSQLDCSESASIFGVIFNWHKVNHTCKGRSFVRVFRLRIMNSKLGIFKLSNFDYSEDLQNQSMTDESEDILYLV